MPTICGKEIGAIGYGLMGLTWRDTPPSQEQQFAAMDAALEAGSNFWNGGELYGPEDANSLHLLRDYFRARPGAAEKVVLSIKGGVNIKKHSVDGSAEGMRRSVENCISILEGTKKIDIFEIARIDKKVSLEETFGTLKELVAEGKIGAVTLSEVNANTIRAVHKIVPVVGVEVELSLFATDILHNNVASTCAELGVPVIAYSPLGRGILTGAIKSQEDAKKMPHIGSYPKYSGDAFDQNFKLVQTVLDFAEKKNAKPSQIAIAWTVELGKMEGMPEILPIPGASHADRVRENTTTVSLTKEEMEQLNDILKEHEVIGTRYPEAAMAMCEG